MIRPCIVVYKFEADATIKKLRVRGFLDNKFQIDQVGNMVYIPLRSGSNYQKTHDFPTRQSPIDRIMEKISAIGIDTHDISYVRLGNSLIFKNKITVKIAEMFSYLPGIKNIYFETGKIKGVKRKPSLKRLYGDGETRVIEYGITYILDLEKVMFSPGNINTRSKMLYLDFTDSVVIDMFCGIGYFSLPVIKNSMPARMICCDINQDSIDYLIKNIHENRINYPVEILTGDSRSVLPFISADYIIMGNFNSPAFLCAALIRSKSGTKISMHFLATRDSIDSREINIIYMARKIGYIIECISRSIVKSVGPNYIHINSIFMVLRII